MKKNDFDSVGFIEITKIHHRRKSNSVTASVSENEVRVGGGAAAKIIKTLFDVFGVTTSEQVTRLVDWSVVNSVFVICAELRLESWE